ncbi:hypothetical protein J6590_087030 [Homalodisca vitripennis]|nr:hypothetical protein J6590_087030 [Homalodisca vitripennis]
MNASLWIAAYNLNCSLAPFRPLTGYKLTPIHSAKTISLHDVSKKNNSLVNPNESGKIELTPLTHQQPAAKTIISRNGQKQQKPAGKEGVT